VFCEGELLVPEELAPWLLRSRVTPPRQLKRLIQRERLLRSLRLAQPGQVVFMCAPPGFGKSVALAQWYTDAKAHDVRSGWLALDGSDDPATTVQYLAFACHLAGLNLAHTGLLTAHLPGPPSLGIQSLLACIEQTARHWLLIVDAAERASQAVVREVFHPLTCFFPGNLTLAIASRDSGLLDLSDLSQRGLLLPIAVDTLRFDRDETRELCGGSATQAQVRAIEQRSGGWPALLQLMLQCGSSPRFDSAPAPEAETSAITTFVETRLLARVDDHTRKAMFRLSLLETFTAALAKELLDHCDIEHTIARLKSLGILSTVNAAAVMQFGMHSVIRRYLAARFFAEQPTEARDLHRRAALAYLPLGDFVQAARHAAATGDDEFLGDIVEAVSPLILGAREGYPRTHQIVRFIPVTLARRRLRVGYACVASYIKAGRLNDAKGLFDDLEITFRDAGGHADSSPLLFERAVCHSLLAVYKGTTITGHHIEALDSFVTATPSLAPMIRCLAETMRSFVQQQASQFRDAKASAWRAIGSAEEADAPASAYFMYCDLGMIAGVEGQCAEAFEMFDHCNAANLATVRQDERMTSIRDAFRIEVEHELDPDRTTHNGRLKNICVRLPTLEGWLDVYAAAYRTYSEQLYMSGDLGAALAILGVGLDHLAEQGIEGAPEVLRAQRALLLALAGRGAEAKCALEQLLEQIPEPQDLLNRPWRQAEALVEAQAVYELKNGQCRSPDFLSGAIQRAKSTGNVRSEIRFRWLRIARRRVASEKSQTASDFQRLAVLEGISGFKRSRELYARTLGRPFPPPSAESVSPETGAQRPRHSTNYFTQREKAVIVCLGRGLSDKRIAADLGITAHGVRYHLKRIYVKLNADGRGEAREKASQLGIV
jgi:LuxR family maltose regulon positive regulatory protein